ncbi:hypothetical protein AVEN_95899-1 [Araneus ventricosus]|uniref:CCHC-type domain-containing protein n=1 Tax=Araneus ventricosus TaxID=182803 RepID=A0A4Y2Q4R2_ARAVE|nr:hypothetical protein AVEN_95899-1 [Araneus ventricosus]
METADPGLAAILYRVTDLLSEIGLDDERCGKFVGLIFEVFGLRNTPVIREERTLPKPSSRKKAKSTKRRSPETAVNQQEVKDKISKGREVASDKASEEQPERAPLNFASAAQKGANLAQNPPVRVSVPNTKKAPPARTNMSRAKKSGVFLAHPKEDSGIQSSSQLLRFLGKHVSLGAIGVKLVSTRPIKDNGLVLVTETKAMSEILHSELHSGLPRDSRKDQYADRGKETKWIRKLCKSNNLPEGEISARFRRKGQKETVHWILALDPYVYKGIPAQGRLDHGFISIRYRECLEPTRCFKCQKFGHIKSQCPDLKGPDHCTKCTGTHMPKGWKAKRPTCRNCVSITTGLVPGRPRITQSEI